MSVDPDKLIDDIYEASFIPELWPNILGHLATMSDGVGSILFTQSQDSIKWVASEAAKPIMSAFIDEGWLPKNTRAIRCLNSGYTGFINDFDLYTETELASDPTYVDFFRPRGLGWCSGTVILSPSRDMIVFDVERLYDKGPVSRDILQILDTFRPHLARAALASARLGLERARGIVNAFDRMGLPGAVLTKAGRIVAANPALEAMKEQVRLRAFDKIAFCDINADGLFADGIRQCRQSRNTVLSFALPGEGEAPPAVAHLLPLHGQAHDIFARGELVLLITPLTNPGLPQASIIATLFDLTPAESRVARLICSGETAQMIAAQLAVSPETIRTHTKAVMAKVGVRRQIELAQLLSATVLPGRR